MTALPHSATVEEEAPSTQVRYWAHLDSPLGKIYMARTTQGLCRVSFGVTETDFLAEFEDLQASCQPDAFFDLTQQLEAYFTGEPITFEVTLDLSNRTPFQREVMRYVYAVPFGAVCTYGQIAKDLGSPRAARAVGSVMASNPMPLIVPCHRVITSTGKLGGYSSPGGLDDKRFLLTLEGSLPPK